MTKAGYDTPEREAELHALIDGDGYNHTVASFIVALDDWEWSKSALGVNKAEAVQWILSRSRGVCSIEMMRSLRAKFGRAPVIEEVRQELASRGWPAQRVPG